MSRSAPSSRGATPDAGRSAPPWKPTRAQPQERNQHEHLRTPADRRRTDPRARPLARRRAGRGTPTSWSSPRCGRPPDAAAPLARSRASLYWRITACSCWPDAGCRGAVVALGVGLGQVLPLPGTQATPTPELTDNPTPDASSAPSGLVIFTNPRDGYELTRAGQLDAGRVPLQSAGNDAVWRCTQRQRSKFLRRLDGEHRQHRRDRARLRSWPLPSDRRDHDRCTGRRHRERQHAEEAFGSRPPMSM